LPFRPVKDAGSKVAAQQRPDYIMAASLAAGHGKPSMYAILSLISTVIQIYIYLLVASAILSWLVAFNVVNTRNQLVAMIADVLYRVTEPVLAPIRRILPNFGGLDISPIVVILLLIFVNRLLWEMLYGIYV
jgi:YggT family protein